MSLSHALRLPLLVVFLIQPGCQGGADRPSRPKDVSELEDTSPCEGLSFSTWYPDVDDDGWGVEEGAIESCQPLYVGYAEEPGDCDDTKPDVHPYKGEDCETPWDDDCNGYTNKRSPFYWTPGGPRGCTDWYLDRDGDGFGRLDEHACMCASEGPFTAPDPGDCDDTNPNIYPGAGGCLTIGDASMVARIDGGEGHIVHDATHEWPYRVAEVTGDGVLDLVLVLTTFKTDDGYGGVFIVPGPLIGPISLEDPRVIRHYASSSGPYGINFFDPTVTIADMNGDGTDDVIVMGYGAPGEVGIGILDGGRWLSEGFAATTTFLVSPSDQGGLNPALVTSSADLDGDGLVELIIGHPLAADGGESAGVVTIVQNPAAGLVDVGVDHVARLIGESANDQAGACIADAGDTDGDGLGDLLIGAPHQDRYRGAAYLVRGPVVGSVLLADADTKLVGPTTRGLGGCGLAGGGDADGDGRDDLMVGAYTSYSEDGAAFLVLSSLALSGTHSLPDVASSAFLGQEVEKPATFWTGVDLAFVQTDDATAALAIGSGYADIVATDSGAVTYVHHPEPGVFRVGSVGVTLSGAETDHVIGRGLAAAPDIDGDGFGELLLAAPEEEPGDVYNAGSVFVVSGAWLAQGQ